MGSSQSSHKITAQDKAILDLKVQRDKLQQYQKRIKSLTDRETEAARRALAEKNRSGALLALRRKKYQESLLAKTDQQLAQLQQLTLDVEFALVQKDVLYGLQQGTDVLKEIRKEMGGLEGVEKLVGRNEEEIQYQREISEMLDGKMSVEEEDEVQEELRLLEGKVQGKVAAMPEVPTRTEPLPQVPAEGLKTQIREEPAERPAEELLPA